jgi:hypothetical protein
VTFLTDADARVDEANPGKNYGRSSYLQADGISTPDIEAYLRFTVSGVSNIVQSAKFRIYVTTNGTKNGPAIYTTGASWSETDIVWNNRPQPTSGEIANIGAIGTSTWVEYDVTPFVTGDGTYSFALVADSADGITFSSREGSVPPQLVLTLGASAGTPTPTLVPTSAPPTPTLVPTSVPPTPAPPSPTPTNGAGDAVLLAAGDIASCSSSGDEATAKLLDTPADTILTLGDNVYEDGTASEFANCFHPSWGQYKARIRPSVGNHEYHTAGASGYFNYFGAVAGDPNQGYYAYDLGAWHIIALNSNCAQVGGCGKGSPQEQWLRADLAAHPSACTLAYWHHPRFSSGQHGSTTAMQPIWQALYDAGVELVLSGHDHDYERFAPQDPVGRADPTRGIRQFVVGTGGKSHYSVNAPIANSEVRNDNTFGLLKLTLHANHYDWEFIPQAGATFTDSGTALCHG